MTPEQRAYMEDGLIEYRLKDWDTGMDQDQLVAFAEECMRYGRKGFDDMTDEELIETALLLTDDDWVTNCIAEFEGRVG